VEEYPRVIQRKTQTADYWRDFTLNSDDLALLRALLLDGDEPLTTQELATALVTERCRREEAELRAELARGTIYQPKKSYEVGEKVIFPALDFRLGEVIGIRPGENPEYGAFDVINIDFGPDRRQRGFAANLTAPHKLNEELSDQLASSDLASPEMLLSTLAGDLQDRLVAQLSDQPGFATFEGRWLLRDLLAESAYGDRCRDCPFLAAERAGG
jgi:hypothetical protein